MKTTVISLTTVAVAIFLSGSVHSQGSFSIHAGPSFPVSDFGDDDMNDDDAGLAGVGLNVGVKYVYLLNDKGLGLYFGADFNYNGLQRDVREDIEDELQFGSSNVDITFYKYINVPVTTGVQYRVKVNDKISLFGDVGVGLDFLKITNLTMKVDNEEAGASFKSSTELAYKIGGGILINDKFMVGLHHNGLGDHSVKSQLKYDGIQEDIDDLELKVSLLSLTFGIKF
jgi:opacity protein-like surface antigen